MDYDYAILGAGIAGLCLADRLQEKGKRIILIDPKGIGQGASGTPSALLNPATGRYANQSWRAEECIRSCYQTLEKVQKDDPETLFLKNGVVRPASDEEIATKMLDNFKASDWPEDWCTWLTEEEFNKDYPGLKCSLGGLKVKIGITVKLPMFLHSFSKYLQARGVDIIEGNPYRIEHHDLQVEGIGGFECRHFITTAGIRSLEIEPWSSLPLIPVKGQIAIFRRSGGFPYPSSVSSMGYYTPYDDHHIAAGSSYEHRFEHEEPDQRGLDYLTGRLQKVMPAISEQAKPVHQWAGVRASTPGRMPILGTHPVYPNHSIMTGLGSKGLLYSSYLADRMSSYLEEGHSLPHEVQLDRFLN